MSAAPAARATPSSDPFDDLRPEPRLTRTMSMSVADQLRRLIVANRLAPGTPLRLAVVGARLGTSVQPVREAVRMLAAEGLVVIEPHRGAYVASLSIEDVEELYAVRAALEGLITRVATARATDEDRAAVEGCFARMQDAERADDRPAFIVADRAFHERLYQAADRPRLLARIRDLWDASTRARPLLYERWLPLEDVVRDHEPVLIAVRARDPAAAEAATKAHLEGAARRVLAVLHTRG